MRTPRLIALFALAALLLNFPLLALWDHGDVRIGGLPLLPTAVFVGWALVIGAAAWIVERRDDEDADADDRAGGGDAGSS
jgi:hypothetical protein